MRKVIYRFDNGRMYAKIVPVKQVNLRGFVAEIWTKDTKLIYDSARNLLMLDVRTPEEIARTKHLQPYFIWHIQNANKQLEPEVVRYRERVRL